jgi:phosphatidylserine synthase
MAMSQAAVPKRPDPYADENTLVRRRRGVTLGVYEGFTIAALACLVAIMFFLGVDSRAQKSVSVVAFLIAATFIVAMTRRKSRWVEPDRTRLLVAAWLVGTEICWVAMLVVLFLPMNLLWELGPIYATAIGAAGVILTATGTVIHSMFYGRDWESRKGHAN